MRRIDRGNGLWLLNPQNVTPNFVFVFLFINEMNSNGDCCFSETITDELPLN